MADAPSRWPQFARALRKQALMDEMMEAQGVDLLAALKTGEAFVRARANCRDCDCERCLPRLVSRGRKRAS
ncbi:MAG TPA: hypothetical protein VF090_08805 [Methyloceanibacter sp.]|jgi:hypothetical protein